MKNSLRIQSYKDLIPESLEETIKILKMDLSGHSTQYNEVINFQSRLKNLEADRMKGIKSEDSLTLERNQLTISLIQFISELEEKASLFNNNMTKDYSLNKNVSQEEKLIKRLSLFGKKRRLNSKEGKEIYTNQVSILKNTMKQKLEDYCELGNIPLSFKGDESDWNKAVIDNIFVIKLMPCVDNLKRFFWISVGTNIEINFKSTTDVFVLDYSDDEVLVWVNKETSKLMFTGEDLALNVVKNVIGHLLQYYEVGNNASKK